jgi:hypothetical protein
LGAKLTLPHRLNERRIIAPTAMIADASDRLTKQTFELRRKSGWSVNSQEQVTNLGEQSANFIAYGFCHAPTNARFITEVDMQLLSSYFWVA